MAQLNGLSSAFVTLSYDDIISFWILLIISLQNSNCTAARNGNEITISNCTCQGYKQIIYECTIFGEGATVWRGSAFNCPYTHDEIILFYNNVDTVQNSCNDGAMTADIVRVDGNSYTSQLIVNVSEEIIGQNITCVFDGIDLIEIGLSVLLISEEPLDYYNSSFTCNGNYTELKLWDNDLTQNNSFTVVSVICDGNVSIPVKGDVLNNTTEESTTVTFTGTSAVPSTAFVLTLPIILVIVIFAILFILGLLVVCCLVKKLVNLLKHNTKQRSALAVNTVEVPGTSSEQPESNIIYAEVDPKDVTVSNQPQHGVIPFQEDNTHYAEIDYQAETLFLNSLSRSDHKLAVNLDLLLILLKNDITPRWYEFGLAVGVPKETLDICLEYPSEQSVIEVLDYWLRHFPGQLTWSDVAQALNEIHLPQLAEKVLEISATGRLPTDITIKHMSDQSNVHPGIRHDCLDHDLNTSSPPVLPPKGHRKVDNNTDGQHQAEIPPLPPKF